jgi:hypothetical protein
MIIFIFPCGNATLQPERITVQAVPLLFGSAEVVPGISNLNSRDGGRPV